MSTDTAFALGALALAGGSRLPDRVRTYLLTFSVVDDLLGLAVIAIFYSSHVHWVPLLIGAVLLATDGVMTRRGISATLPAYLVIGVAAWVAFWESGVDPIVAGLVIGLPDLRLPGRPGEPGAGHRHLPAVPRAAHRAAGVRGPRGGPQNDLAERAAAGALHTSGPAT